jgi:hypothetical protein
VSSIEARVNIHPSCPTAGVSCSEGASGSNSCVCVCVAILISCHDIFMLPHAPSFTRIPQVIITYSLILIRLHAPTTCATLCLGCHIYTRHVLSSSMIDLHAPLCPPTHLPSCVKSTFQHECLVSLVSTCLAMILVLLSRHLVIRCLTATLNQEAKGDSPKA